MRNKRGVANLVLFFLIVIGVMAFGLILAFGGASLKVFYDNSAPAFKSVDTFNGHLAQSVTYLDSLSSTLGTALGFIYMLCLIGILGIAWGFRVSGNKLFLVPFFVIAIFVVIGSILISNIYENAYRGSGLFAQTLQQMTLISWLLLYSPIIITIIVFIGGAIIFSGFEEVAI